MPDKAVKGLGCNPRKETMNEQLAGLLEALFLEAPVRCSIGNAFHGSVAPTSGSVVRGNRTPIRESAVRGGRDTDHSGSAAPGSTRAPFNLERPSQGVPPILRSAVHECSMALFN